LGIVFLLITLLVFVEVGMIDCTAFCSTGAETAGAMISGCVVLQLHSNTMAKHKIK
jgi:hypothetical protein